MNIIIFGAAGDVGRRTVNEALDRGHQVTAVVRRLRTPSPFASSVNVLVRDVASATDLDDAIAGHDLAISALRPPDGEEESLVALTKAIVDAARIASVRFIVVGGAAFRGDEGETERQLGKRELAVAVQKTGGLESLEGLSAPLGEETERKNRIDLPHHQLQPTKGAIEVDPCPTSNLLTLGELLPAVGEEASDLLVVVSPRDRLELADDLIFLSLLDELEVEVPALGYAQPIDFPGHPDGGIGLPQEIPDLTAQCADRVSLVLNQISGSPLARPRKPKESIGPTRGPLCR